MKPSLYIVVYRDSPRAVPRYFGVFPTLTQAFDFRDNLKDPLPGGTKHCVALQRFMSTEHKTVNEYLQREREVHQQGAVVHA